MEIRIPESSLVVLIGPSAAGKSTFAHHHFLPSEILSSDAFRLMITNDMSDQSASADAFELLHHALRKRLARNLLTVVDATNLQVEARQELLTIAKEYQVPTVSILFDLPDESVYAQNRLRGEQSLAPHVIRRHMFLLKKTRRILRHERFRYRYQFHSVEEMNQVRVIRTPLRVDRRLERGPFDIIGDTHGCLSELLELLSKLGYQVTQVEQEDRTFYRARHPQERKLLFLGDLVDRGPDSPGVIDLVRDLVNAGIALVVSGNHDQKLVRYLHGKRVELAFGIEQTIEQMKNRSESWKKEALHFLEGLPSHYVLDAGRLVIAHAGLPEQLQGRTGGRVRNFALYGETAKGLDQYGLPIRINWAESYRGDALVLYGHTPVLEPTFYHNTLNIDTGCVFGGKLTALRYPERELVSVPAKETYADPRRPFRTPNEIAPGIDGSLYTRDLLESLRIKSRFHPVVNIRNEQALAAFEEMNRFAIDPRWLIYLPPTMSPSETSSESGYLEHPLDAFRYYQQRGIEQVICEEKHMGSRAIVIVCKTPEVAVSRFRLEQPSSGIIYSRTGRRFFDDEHLEQAMLSRIATAMEKAGFWEQFHTDWACLDCELMPWSAKAQGLLKNQYAAVGAAAEHALQDVVSQLNLAKESGREVDQLLSLYEEKQKQAHLFRSAYRQYCWPVNRLEDYKLAPFHLMATEGKVYDEQNHLWHMQALADICKHDEELLMTTATRIVHLQNEEEVNEAIQWWIKQTEQGGEGMVVKPEQFLVRGEKGLIQPAIKCRGQEYLRIIYGPEYNAPHNLERLRKRGLKKKRSLAVREFALGLESLNRFVEREPLYRVHECVFAILALEAEPIDPRL
ncbi:polynucleotide 3'-phosphatase /polynucleotide 5'-hydroxyl-kinase /polynucleotide 2',3'-cyclic phosphate phosphodiesterase [Seinonella peptonophila]|uniref:Polynucleotide 3'-phosphatase /polynucleotide 5'-hydroxyl-kinase /polynucleotide 2',3'-cyclic phosphate phosphodiesterase n=1 Tax=Seinonella peptonophila TaxID=112248 RepID=A0A1M5AID1_9BACL|nr:polynucleotide kinase-phosphatase [Seinonella peptonophila]SHF29897.1 polynucleotide 3'-phosphatase /polynucleotide 5'-hydroxyl-kinase /polynucleotide 2',3'-cyclic phosphate phosphodiesterase [Seinonella peptonophila]